MEVIGWFLKNVLVNLDGEGLVGYYLSMGRVLEDVEGDLLPGGERSFELDDWVVFDIVFFIKTYYQAGSNTGQKFKYFCCF